MVDDHIQFANSILQNHKFSIGIGNRKIIRLIANRIKVSWCSFFISTIFLRGTNSIVNFPTLLNKLPCFTRFLTHRHVFMMTLIIANRAPETLRRTITYFIIQKEISTIFVFPMFLQNTILKMVLWD